MLHNSPSALELTQAYCSFVLFFSPTPSIVFLVAVKKCVMPLSGPLVDHRPRRSKWFEEVDVTWGPRGGNVTLIHGKVDVTWGREEVRSHLFMVKLM